MATDGQPVVPTQGQPVVLRSTDESHTGIVCENMQGLGAKLRKLPGQAKICTPPGGEVIAKICVLRYIPFSPLSPPSGGGYRTFHI